jgi:hypothetical protein
MPVLGAGLTRVLRRNQTQNASERRHISVHLRLFTDVNSSNYQFFAGSGTTMNDCCLPIGVTVSPVSLPSVAV